MNKIQVKVLDFGFEKPSFVGITGMLAKLTQKGHKIKTVDDLEQLYNSSLASTPLVGNVMKMGHGSVIRHAPLTITIVGGSRRLLGQLRTHHVGIDWVSASLQYSDYSKDAQFVVPYEVLKGPDFLKEMYLEKCEEDAKFYGAMITAGFNNDTAGYTMNQAMRNVVVATANMEAWLNLINRRSCHRNTEETQYVAHLIWQAIEQHRSSFGATEFAGPDCLHGCCKEGSMRCGDPVAKGSTVQQEINRRWSECSLSL